MKKEESKQTISIDRKKLFLCLVDKGVVSDFLNITNGLCRLPCDRFINDGFIWKQETDYFSIK